MNRYDDATRYGDHFIRPSRVLLFQNKEISRNNQLAFLFYLQEKEHLSKFDSQFVPALINQIKPWSAYFTLAGPSHISIPQI